MVLSTGLERGRPERPDMQFVSVRHFTKTWTMDEYGMHMGIAKLT